MGPNFLPRSIKDTLLSAFALNVGTGLKPWVIHYVISSISRRCGSDIALHPSNMHLAVLEDRLADVRPPCLCAFPHESDSAQLFFPGVPSVWLMWTACQEQSGWSLRWLPHAANTKTHTHTPPTQVFSLTLPDWTSSQGYRACRLPPWLTCCCI